MFSHKIDNFLSNFTEFRGYASSLSYEGTINPLDGIVYPGINVEIPNHVTEEVLNALYRLYNTKVHLAIPLCLRLSTEGVAAPNKVHTDSMMSQFNFILYMTDSLPGVECGTQTMRHVTGMTSNPVDEVEQAIFDRDCKDDSKWEVVTHYQMKANTAVIIPSYLYHQAVPVNGFGTDASNGRLVLLGFFNI